MVKITIKNIDDIEIVANQLVVIGLFEDNSYSEHLKNNSKLKVVIDYLDSLDKKKLDQIKKYGKTIALGLYADNNPINTLLIGLGNSHDFNKDKMRHISGLISLRAKEMGYNDIVIPNLISEEESKLEPLVEGIVLSLYEFNKFKTDIANESRNHHLSSNNEYTFTVGLNHADFEKCNALVKTVKSVCDGVIFSRDLANSPPNIIYPDTLAKAAQALESKNDKIHVEVMDLKKIEELGLNGIISVGKGSQNEPRLIIVEYNNSSTNDKPVLLVGKAVTFDTGGISIKPSERMDEMKFDKSGGCTVLGIMHALSSLNLPVNVVAVIPSVENMPSGTSYRPGDIIRMYNGKTVEVLNTDAEGRLILADALAYGISKYSPKSVIDFATLTGACIIALGTNVAGLIGNDEKLIQKLLSSSKNTGEKIWQLPLYDEFLDLIKSNVATIKNIGGRTGGTITAAAFLSHFVQNVPWAHLDIAGTAWTQDGTADRSYNPKGSTGFGVRLIMKFLMDSQ
jgi:leucyl aminopeptidase